MPMRPWSMFVDWLHGISARSAPAAPRQQPHERPPDVEPPREVDLLRAAERDAIVATYLNGRLQALGFVQVAPRRWVDGSIAPVRRVFEMQLLKGAAMKAVWGFSLDFVPHLSGGRVCWHRSNRTAMFDLYVELEDRIYASFLHGAAWLHHGLERLTAHWRVRLAARVMGPDCAGARRRYSVFLRPLGAERRSTRGAHQIVAVVRLRESCR
jgi:hypothetical protein